MLDVHAGNTLNEQVEADLAAGAAGRGVPAALEEPGGAALALEAPSAAGGLPVRRAMPWGACVGAGAVQAGAWDVQTGQAWTRMTCWVLQLMVCWHRCAIPHLTEHS